MDNQQFTAFVSDVKKRAEFFIGEEYISEDVRKCLRDFLQVAENFAALQSDSMSMGADARLAKKRLDQAKTDIRTQEKRVEQLKSTGLGLIIPVKQLTNELSSITEPTLQARFKAGLQKIADAVIEISKI